VTKSRSTNPHLSRACQLLHTATATAHAAAGRDPTSVWIPRCASLGIARDALTNLAAPDGSTAPAQADPLALALAAAAELAATPSGQRPVGLQRALSYLRLAIADLQEPS